MLKKIKVDREVERNYEWYIYLIIFVSLVIGLYFFFAPEMTLQDMANFVQLPILVAIATSAIINVKNYTKLVDSEIQKTSKTYNRLVENRNKIDQLFLNNKKLDRLYSEMYPELAYTDKSKKSEKVDRKVIRSEHSACSIIYQFMSEIFTQMQTEVNYPLTVETFPYFLNTQKGQDYVEWLKTFAKWCRSPILRRHWQYFRDEHHPEFNRFASNFFKLGGTTCPAKLFSRSAA